MSDITFKSLNINKKIIDGLYVSHPKPLSEVEAKVIPLMLKNKSVIALSPTGTGKTFSYVVPILSRIEDSNDYNNIKSIVVLPTNVLGFQVENVFNNLIKNADLKNVNAFFFTSIKEISSAKNIPNIAIVTPSIYPALLKKFDLSKVESIIIDEGDMILFDGFYDEMVSICSSLPNAKKSFFSASIAKQFLVPVKKICKSDEIIDCNHEGVNNSNISHYLVDLKEYEREKSLLVLLNSDACRDKTGIVFVSKNEQIPSLKKLLENNSIKYTLISGNMDKRSIYRNIKDFSNSDSKLILGTDYASRGIDIPYVQFVISFDLPMDLNFYFHRAGRSGRFNQPGSSFLLCNKDDLKKARELVRRGVNFKYATIKKDEFIFINAKPKSTLNKKSNDDYIVKAIYKAKKKSPKVVKPGYKKKIKTAINIAKNKHKKKIIRTNLNKKNNTYGNS